MSTAIDILTIVSVGFSTSFDILRNFVDGVQSVDRILNPLASFKLDLVLWDIGVQLQLPTVVADARKHLCADFDIPAVPDSFVESDESIVSRAIFLIYKTKLDTFSC